MKPSTIGRTPFRYLCPLTRQIMKHPMMSKDGIHFDREAILQYLQNRAECPVSGKPLRISQLISDKNLQKEIETYLQRIGAEDSNDDSHHPQDSADANAPPLVVLGPNYQNIPDRFLCPLTKQIMQDPVMSKEGVSFERHAILEVLAARMMCPVTHTPLLPSGLVRNSKLKQEIEEYQGYQGEERSISQIAAEEEDDELSPRPPRRSTSLPVSFSSKVPSVISIPSTPKQQHKAKACSRTTTTPLVSSMTLAQARESILSDWGSPFDLSDLLEDVLVTLDS